MRKYIRIYRIYGNFIYLKAFLKIEIFSRKSHNINYEIFKAFFKTLNGVYKIDKIFFKIFTSPRFCII